MCSVYLINLSETPNADSSVMLVGSACYLAYLFIINFTEIVGHFVILKETSWILFQVWIDF